RGYREVRRSMREIKFRAWNKRLGLMFDDVQKTETEDISNEHLASLGYYLDNADYELMQYTGLRDKTGKHIYEGDILRVEDQPQSGDFNNATYVFEAGNA